MHLLYMKLLISMLSKMKAIGTKRSNITEKLLVRN